MSYILSERGEWVGPPVLKLTLKRGAKELVLDGRIRLKEHEQRGLRSHIPEQVVTSHYEAIRQLMYNGHNMRAVKHAEEFVPTLVGESASVIAALLRLKSHHKAIKFSNALKSPKERHKLPRRAMAVVKRLRILYHRSQEGSDITIRDLETALGEFIDD